MRGDVEFRVYGLHEGRDADYFLGAFRSHAEADAQIAERAAPTMHGERSCAQMGAHEPVDQDARSM
jgi:hypothetical protein